MIMSVKVICVIMVSSTVAVSGAAVTPIQKVIQLLEGMKMKGQEEIHNEQVQYSVYAQWCSDTEATKTESISNSKSNIERLSGAIFSNKTKSEELQKEINDLVEDVSYWQGDQNASTKVRQIENKDYLALHQDLSESIDALERAVATLQNENYDREQQKSALVQVRDLVPLADNKELQAFLQDDFSDRATPDAHAYEFGSQSVIDLLKDLHTKFTKQRKDAEEKERKNKNAFEVLSQDLASQISFAQESTTRKGEERGDALTQKAADEGDRSDEQSTMDNDKTFLSETKAICSQKARDFDARQELRQDEIAAIDEAVTVLSSSKTQLGVGHRSFIQLRASSQMAKRQIGVSRFLTQRASQLGSSRLAMLAVRVADDPFNKVRKMINQMIQRLEEEANAEADAKASCDTDLAANKMRRKQSESEVAKGVATANSLTARISKLMEEITNLSSSLAELSKDKAEAEENRQAEHDENVKVIDETGAAREAVRHAVSVLKKFYDKAAQATSLVQTGQPAIFDEAYSGMQGESGGVVGLLEVILSDLNRTQSDTEMEEEQAAEEHRKFLEDAEVNQTAMEKSKEHKENAKREAESDKTDNQAALDDSQNELLSHNKTYDALKERCIKTGVNYEERARRREEEIQSLTEALKILQGEEE